MSKSKPWVIIGSDGSSSSSEGGGTAAAAAAAAHLRRAGASAKPDPNPMSNIERGSVSLHTRAMCPHRPSYSGTLPPLLANKSKAEAPLEYTVLSVAGTAARDASMGAAGGGCVWAVSHCSSALLRRQGCCCCHCAAAARALDVSPSLQQRKTASAWCKGGLLQGASCAIVEGWSLQRVAVKASSALSF